MNSEPSMNSGTTDPVQSVTIVGGGTAGWMTAAVLSQLLRKVKVRLVESDEIGIIGVGEATIPHIRNYMALAGVDQLRMLHASKATFKLGIQFVGWGAPGESYIHGFGRIGRDMLWLHTHQLWLAAKERGLDVGHFDNYAINCRAALDNRFRFQDSRLSNTPLADLDFAYHFDASLLARFLRGESEGRGVERIEGRIVDVAKDGETGFVDEVILADGRRIGGDLFVDCSGMRGLLIEGALGVGYEDWSHWLLCNRALAVPSESVTPLTPYTRSTARSAGWQWRIPLQHRIGNGIVYAAELMSDDEAARTLLDGLDSAPLADPRPVRFKPGRRIEAWRKNVVAVGLSGGFLEPLESTSIHLIQTAVHRLLALFPARGFHQADIDEFNLQTKLEYEDIRDFIIAHYKVTRRRVEPFWDYVREMKIPDSLARRIALFESSARFFGHSKLELFAEESWVQVLLGQGLNASGDPVTRFVSDEDLAAYLRDTAKTIAEQSAQMPDHAAFISRLPEREARLEGAIGAPIKRG
ncbi:MAG: tryptophan halogenase family protein [Pseudomonadota bacterium]